MPDDFDVLICGAGPAGLTTALALGSSALRVGLIEKESSPGSKVCGDAIPPYVPKVLNTINQVFSRAFENLNQVLRVDTCRIFGPKGTVLDLKYQESGYMCKRIYFDTFLYEQVCQLQNVRLITGTKVKDVAIRTEHAEIHTTNDLILRSKLVIGCDGAHSISGRKLAGLKPDLKHCSSAVRTYFTNVSGIKPGSFEMHFITDYLPGYFWIFPLEGNQANVGLGMPSNIVIRQRINLKDELLKIVRSDSFKERFSDARISGEIKGYLLPLGSHKIPISGNRYMLCGDAASLIDPATGGGIGQAMVSGRFAGWQAVKCFDAGNFSAEFMKSYDRNVYKKLWKENRNRRFIRDFIVRNSGILESVIQLGSKNRFLRNTMIKILS